MDISNGVETCETELEKSEQNILPSLLVFSSSLPTSFKVWFSCSMNIIFCILLPFEGQGLGQRVIDRENIKLKPKDRDALDTLEYNKEDGVAGVKSAKSN